MQLRTRNSPRHLAAALFVATIGMLALGAGSAQSAAPILGVWSFSGGKVAIQAAENGGFVGKVVSPTRFAECTHEVGEEMWTQIKPQPDGSYWGSHQWFFTSAECIPNPALGPTAWRVLGNSSSQFLRVCFSEPGLGIQPTIAANGSSVDATFGCVDSARVSSLPKLSPTKLSRYVHLPRAKNCLGSRKLRIHLHDPDNDPFVKIEVSLKSGALHRRAKVRRHRHNAIAIVSLVNMPRSSFTVTVKVTTVLEHHLSLRRKYRICGPGSASSKRGSSRLLAAG
jgi:hypothetical protein